MDSDAAPSISAAAHFLAAASAPRALYAVKKLRQNGLPARTDVECIGERFQIRATSPVRMGYEGR